jgi:hypothetical protein
MNDNKVREVTAEELRTIEGGMGTASGFIPGAGTISTAISVAAVATLKANAETQNNLAAYLKA